jgi:hypothetical protein
MDSHFTPILHTKLGQAEINGGGTAALPVRDLRALRRAGTGFLARRTIGHAIREGHFRFKFNRDLEGLDRESLPGGISEAGILSRGLGANFGLDAFFLQIQS